MRTLLDECVNPRLRLAFPGDEVDCGRNGMAVAQQRTADGGGSPAFRCFRDPGSESPIFLIFIAAVHPQRFVQPVEDDLVFVR